jgi:hypothetical protein
MRALLAEVEEKLRESEAIRDRADAQLRRRPVYPERHYPKQWQRLLDNPQTRIPAKLSRTPGVAGGFLSQALLVSTQPTLLGNILYRIGDPGPSFRFRAVCRRRGVR